MRRRTFISMMGVMAAAGVLTLADALPTISCLPSRTAAP